MSKTMDNGADKTYKSPSQLYHKILCLKQVIEHRDAEIERLKSDYRNLVKLSNDCATENDTLRARVEELEEYKELWGRTYAQNLDIKTERDELRTHLATEQANHAATAEQNSYLSARLASYEKSEPKQPTTWDVTPSPRTYEQPTIVKPKVTHKFRLYDTNGTERYLQVLSDGTVRAELESV